MFLMRAFSNTHSDFYTEKTIRVNIFCFFIDFFSQQFIFFLKDISNSETGSAAILLIVINTNLEFKTLLLQN